MGDDGRRRGQDQNGEHGRQASIGRNAGVAFAGAVLHFDRAAQPATHAPDCVIELAFKFDAVQAELHGMGTLVALAANVTDHADELRVIQQLSLASQRFLEQLKYHRLILSSVMSSCAEKDAIAKSQEVTHTWSDAAALVQSIVKKIGANPQ